MTKAEMSNLRELARTQYQLSPDWSCGNRLAHASQDVIALLDALEECELKWSTEKPTKPGWYWWRITMWGKQFSKVYMVEANRHGELYISGLEIIDNINGQWAGPIELPTG